MEYIHKEICETPRKERFEMNENLASEVYEVIETIHGVPLEDILWDEYEHDDSSGYEEPYRWEEDMYPEFDG